jgi:hypothetical protein
MAEAQQEGEWVELYRSLPLTEADQVVRRQEPARFRDGDDEVVDWTKDSHRKRAIAQGINEPDDPPAREPKIVYFNATTGEKREERITAAAVKTVEAWLAAGVRRIPVHPSLVGPDDLPYIEQPFSAEDIGRLPAGLLTASASTLRELTGDLPEPAPEAPAATTTSDQGGAPDA